ncbi:MAG: DUF1801 domain-containing protein [Pirellulaceae bacterium]|nr:DUF1801 domain-containing protein [Pirellulaceae bacterium]
MQSKAATVAKYLAELPTDRRIIVEQVRKVILKNLQEGFEEGMQYGMIGYHVPHSLYPPGYHCDPQQPLPFVALASQKNYLSLYMMPLYTPGGDITWFEKAWAKTGKKLDMGKSCIRFKKIEDLALDVIAQAIARVSVKKWIEIYETTLKSARTTEGKAKAKQGKSARKPARKK